MQWYGMRGCSTDVNTTASGLEFDVVKSQLQKSIRRGTIQKAVLSAIEIYRLREVGGDAGVTNMYNRLAIIAAEDIGVADLDLVIEVLNLVHTPRRDKSHRDKSHRDKSHRDAAELLGIVHALCAAQKTRLMSHAAYAYTTGMKISPRIDRNYVNAHMHESVFLPHDDIKIRPGVLMFQKSITHADYTAYTWAHIYLKESQGVKLELRNKFIQSHLRARTRKPDILLWHVLAKFLDARVHDALVHAYFAHTESAPFLELGILAAIHRVPYTPLNIQSIVDAWRDPSSSLQDMLAGKFVLVPDDVAIDKHTRQGRAMGRGMQHFVHEGALVYPQSLTYYNAELEALYKTQT